MRIIGQQILKLKHQYFGQVCPECGLSKYFYFILHVLRQLLSLVRGTIQKNYSLPKVVIEKSKTILTWRRTDLFTEETIGDFWWKTRKKFYK